VEQLDAQAVLDLLSQVDPQYQAAVALFYLEDYSYLEIAEILQVPLGTVKSRIARGLTQLKCLVQKAAVECGGPGKEGA
jgi:RNA polymerase sigma-70 factor (ECF subfamily)